MKQFSLSHQGLDLEVEFDDGAFLWHRVRLIVNGEPVDERAVFWGTTRLRTSRPQPVIVDARAGFFGPQTPVLREDSQSIPFEKSS